jgi:hypothetical protein
VSPDVRALEAGLVFRDFWSESEAGDDERGVDDMGEETEFGEYVVGMALEMRPAAKTHPPTACLIRVSPVRLPVMKTLLATSRVLSAFVRSVRPDINDEDVEP